MQDRNRRSTSGASWQIRRTDSGILTGQYPVGEQFGTILGHPPERKRCAGDARHPQSIPAGTSRPRWRTPDDREQHQIATFLIFAHLLFQISQLAKPDLSRFGRSRACPEAAQMFQIQPPKVMRLSTDQPLNNRFYFHTLFNCPCKMSAAIECYSLAGQMHRLSSIYSGLRTPRSRQGTIQQGFFSAFLRYSIIRLVEHQQGRSNNFGLEYEKKGEQYAVQTTIRSGLVDLHLSACRTAWGETLIIDPVLDRVDQYLQLIGELDLKLVLAVDTHIHADHVTAIGSWVKLPVAPPRWENRAVPSRVLATDRRGRDTQADSVTLKAVYTPGHTDDSYSFVMHDRVFTGDTLLIRGTGRTDFQNGDAWRTA